MHNIVLHISIYLFPRLHVLCDLSPINNARKHAISLNTLSYIILETKINFQSAVTFVLVKFLEKRLLLLHLILIYS